MKFLILLTLLSTPSFALTAKEANVLSSKNEAQHIKNCISTYTAHLDELIESTTKDGRFDVCEEIKADCEYKSVFEIIDKHYSTLGFKYSVNYDSAFRWMCVNWENK